MSEDTQQSVAQSYCIFDTAIGACGIAWSERGVTRFQLPDADRGATERRLRARAGAATLAEPPPEIARVIADLQRYCAGQKVDLSGVTLDLTGVPEAFRDIFAAARSIPWGETASYGEVARRAGMPGAAREVGQAMARNPAALIIPCHRVLASGNKAGGFSAYGGLLTKERLLALEGRRIGVPADEPLLPGL